MKLALTIYRDGKKCVRYPKTLTAGIVAVEVAVFVATGDSVSILPESGFYKDVSWQFQTVENGTLVPLGAA